MATQTNQSAGFSFFSIAGLICAILSFFSSAFWGFLLAVIAIVSGAIGAVLALLPGTRGGFVSVFAVLIGLAGIGVAVIKLLGAIIT